MITRSQAQASGLIELTYPGAPLDVLQDTQYGRVTYITWLNCEVSRIVSDKTRKAAVVKHDGQVSLWVNPVAVSLEMVN